MKKIQVNFKSSRKSKVKKRIINNLLAGCLRYNLKARCTKEKMVLRIISMRRPFEVKEVSKAMFSPPSFFIFWIKCTRDLKLFSSRAELHVLSILRIAFPMCAKYWHIQGVKGKKGIEILRVKLRYRIWWTDTLKLKTS